MRLFLLCFFLAIPSLTTARDIFTDLSPIAAAIPVVNDPSIPLLPRVNAPENVNLFADPSINIDLMSNNAIFSIEFVPDGQTDKFGEPCYDFPASARAAFTAATNIWSSIIQSSVPITIKACWAQFAGNTLGYSGGGTLHHNFAGAPLSNTLYPASLANSFAGTDLNPGNEDMHLTFNRSFNWYFEVDGNTPSNLIDLVTVVLHEIGHGLGFSGGASYSGGVGSWGYGINEPNIYDFFIKDGGGTLMTHTPTYPNPSTTLGSLLTSNDLWFTGANAKSANSGTNVKVYAPSSWMDGSSFSHLDYDTFNNTPNQLMVFAVSPGESVHSPGEVGEGLLEDLGWNISGAIGTPSITSPSSGSTLSGSSQIFQLDNSGVSVTNWGLYVGTSVGANNIETRFAGGSATSIATSSLPIDGSTVYVRLIYKVGGVWNTAGDYTYTAFSQAGTPSITSPASGSTLSGYSQVFQLDNSGVSITNWGLYAGTSVGANDIETRFAGGSASSIATSNLPTDGSTVYVRLIYKVGGVWNTAGDYTYTASSQAGTPSIISPTSGSTLSGSSQAFQLDNAGINVSNWGLYVGTSVGANNIEARFAGGSATNITASNLPANGSTVYVRLLYKSNGVWNIAGDYTYTSTTS